MGARDGDCPRGALVSMGARDGDCPRGALVSMGARDGRVGDGDVGEIEIDSVHGAPLKRMIRERL